MASASHAMMLTVASFPTEKGAERLASFLRKEYGTSIIVEVRLSISTAYARWLVYVDSGHKDWDTIRILSYGFMPGANA